MEEPSIRMPELTPDWMRDVDDRFGKDAKPRISIPISITKELKEKIDCILTHPLAGQMWDGGFQHFVYAALWVWVEAHESEGIGVGGH